MYQNETVFYDVKKPLFITAQASWITDKNIFHRMSMSRELNSSIIFMFIQKVRYNKRLND